MTDHLDDSEQRLAQRLAAAESRVTSSPAPDPLASRSRTSAARPMLAALASVALVAVVALAIRGPLTGETASPTPGSASPSPSPSAVASGTPSTQPTSAPTPTPTQDLSAPPIVTVTDREDTAGPEIYGLDWLEGWIAYGTDGGRAGAWRLASIGAGWTSNPIDPPFIPFDTGTYETAQSFWVGSVVRIDGGLVAVGSKRVGCCDYVVPAIWTSPDGTPWAYHDQAGSAWSDAAVVPGSAVVNAAGEIVAASSAQLGSVSSIWISPDGLEWVEHPPRLQDFTSMHHLAAGTTNLMAIGDWHAETSQSARAWISADGREWSQLVAPQDAMAFDAIAYDATTDRYVIAGRTADGVALWTTQDGSSWSNSVDIATGEGTVGDLEVANGVVAGVAFEGGFASGRLVAFSAWGGDLRSLTQVTLADGVAGSGASIGLEPDGRRAIVHAELLTAGSDQPEAREWVVEIAGR